jgi:hypothetical protein
MKSAVIVISSLTLLLLFPTGCQPAINQQPLTSPNSTPTMPSSMAVSTQSVQPPNQLRQPKTSSDGPLNGNDYTIERTLSDGAQRNTIAFDGLAFLTGNLCCDSFLPPGKVADFFGFQYLRDNTPEGGGHNTGFLARCANNVLSILNASQRAQMLALATEQAALINEYAYKRFPLMKAFRRQLEGDIPVGSDGLCRSAVMAWSAELYEIDATIGIQRAELFGSIIKSLDRSQKDYLDKMVQGGFQSWVELPDQIDKRSLSHDEHVLIMTCASEMFGWYAGSIEADTYFCPERQGTYFGSFYMKDAPAVGNANYTIDENITGNSGESFLKALTNAQAQLITDLVDIQRADLNEIVEKRRAISAELRHFLIETSIDNDGVISLATRYGELDGEISYYYATQFAEVAKSLTGEQMTQLMKLRSLDICSCSGAYLYSEKIGMPEIINTDFLFNGSD